MIKKFIHVEDTINKACKGVSNYLKVNKPSKEDNNNNINDINLTECVRDNIKNYSHGGKSYL